MRALSLLATFLPSILISALPCAAAEPLAPAAAKQSLPAPAVTAEDFFEYSCVHHYMKANSVPMFDGSLGYAVEYLDAGPELLDALSDAAKIAAAKLPPPNYADPEHGSPAVLAACRRQSRSEQVRKIIASQRYRDGRKETTR